MLAAAGLGFAGYVYAVPYQRMSRLARAQAAELQEERASRTTVAAEAERLKTDLGKREAAAEQRAGAEARRRQSSGQLAGELRTALGALGAVVSQLESGKDAGKIEVSFPVASIFDPPVGTGVSGQGETALRILGAAVQKGGARVTVKARLIPAPPPRAIAQFTNIGEFAMLRAVRAALFLANTGVKPESVAAAGASPLDTRKGRSAGIPDLLEVEIERE